MKITVKIKPHNNNLSKNTLLLIQDIPIKKISVDIPITGSNIDLFIFLFFISN